MEVWTQPCPRFSSLIESGYFQIALLLDIAPAAREPLRKILEIYNIYSPDLLEFLTAMLQVHPEDRLSARELQSLAWVRE